MSESTYDLSNELEEMKERFEALTALSEEMGSAFGDADLIPESEFEEHAQEMAEELGLVSDTWPGNCIDWAEAARQLMQDYTEVEWEGETHYYRE